MTLCVVFCCISWCWCVSVCVSLLIKSLAGFTAYGSAIRAEINSAGSRKQAARFFPFTRQKLVFNSDGLLHFGTLKPAGPNSVYTLTSMSFLFLFLYFFVSFFLYSVFLFIIFLLFILFGVSELVSASTQTADYYLCTRIIGMSLCLIATFRLDKHTNTCTGFQYSNV